MRFSFCERNEAAALKIRSLRKGIPSTVTWEKKQRSGWLNIDFSKNHLGPKKSFILDVQFISEVNRPDTARHGTAWHGPTVTLTDGLYLLIHWNYGHETCTKVRFNQ